MRFYSTRGAHETDFIGAVSQGLAPDGCLYVPEELPRFDPRNIEGDGLEEIGAQLLAPFAAGSSLAPELGALCAQALDFPVPLVPVDKGRGPLWVLEVFHGPTAAFKDVGARFLATVMEQALPSLAPEEGRPLTILVATSGDTGGAVAAAFHRRRGMRVGVLFPKGQVSPRQKHQLTCWSENVRSFEVNGTFDDCQSLVKSAFTDRTLNERHWLSAANSINLGRLLPQVVYHAAASLRHWRAEHRPANFIVPTGNLGNALACIWARAMGMPIGEHHSGHERQSSAARVSGDRRLAASSQHPDAGVRDGCRQSQQHGAAQASRARFRRTAQFRGSLSGQRRRHSTADCR